MHTEIARCVVLTQHGKAGVIEAMEANAAFDQIAADRGNDCLRKTGATLIATADTGTHPELQIPIGHRGLLYQAEFTIRD